MAVKPEYTYPDTLVIGTRGSALALWQANKVKEEVEALGVGIEVHLKIIQTSGDWRPEDGEVRLEVLQGGKAQFAKELEEALLAGEIDLAVHSMKDMEASLPDGLCIPFLLPREDVMDVFLSNNIQKYTDLPKGSVVGTSSVRRQAFLLNKRPDVQVVPLRGNVPTRIKKLRDNQVDATFLALAGLKRLGLECEIASIVDVEDMLPAVGQGAVGIEIRAEDMNKLAFFSQFSCQKTMICVSCERAVLRALEGSCHTPVGVYAILENNELYLRVKVVAPDGAQIWSEEERQKVSGVDDAEKMGDAVGRRLKPGIPEGILG